MNLCLLTFDLVIVLLKHKALYSSIFCKGEIKLMVAYKTRLAKHISIVPTIKFSAMYMYGICHIS